MLFHFSSNMSTTFSRKNPIVCLATSTKSLGISVEPFTLLTTTGLYTLSKTASSLNFEFISGGICALVSLSASDFINLAITSVSLRSVFFNKFNMLSISGEELVSFVS